MLINGVELPATTVARNPTLDGVDAWGFTLTYDVREADWGTTDWGTTPRGEAATMARAAAIAGSLGASSLGISSLGGGKQTQRWADDNS